MRKFLRCNYELAICLAARNHSPRCSSSNCRRSDYNLPRPTTAVWLSSYNLPWKLRFESCSIYERKLHEQCATLERECTLSFSNDIYRCTQVLIITVIFCYVKCLWSAKLTLRRLTKRDSLSLQDIINISRQRNWKISVKFNTCVSCVSIHIFMLI